MTQRDMAIYLDVTPVTLRNWRKNKPNLYRMVMLGFEFDKVVKKAKETYEDLEKLSASISVSR
jgi:DNA-binding XRE family transcriptional regulator